MSQQALADLMRARGWKWSQATVWAVEKGERPLRLAEATDLAELLKCQVWNFTSGSEALVLMTRLAYSVKDLGEAAQRVEEAVGGLVGLRGDVEFMLDQARRLISDLDPGDPQVGPLEMAAMAAEHVYGWTAPELATGRALESTTWGSGVTTPGEPDEESPIEAGDGNTVDMLTELEKRVALAKSDHRKGQGRGKQQQQRRRGSGG